MALTKVTGKGVGQLTSSDSDFVIQVVSNSSDTVTNVTSGATTNILSQAITPKATSSKILVRAALTIGSDSNSYGYCKLLRGSSAIGVSTQASGSQINASFQVMALNWTYSNYRAYPHIFEFLDSPNTTSATTYNISCTCTSADLYLNRSANLVTDNVWTPATVSTLTLMEIAG